MNLLIVTHLFPNSSDTTYGIGLVDQFGALKEIGVDLKIVVPIPYMPKVFAFIKPSWKKYVNIESQANIYGIDIFYIRYIKLPGQWFLRFEGAFMFIGIKKFLKNLRKIFKYQVVLGGGMLTNDGYTALKIGQNDNIPAYSYIIGSDINVYPYISKSIYKLTYKLLNQLYGVISVGKQFATSTEEKFPGLNKKIIWNSLGIDLKRFRPKVIGEPSFFKEKYPVQNEDIIFFFVGHLIEQKGIKTLLDALLLIKDKPIKIFLAGSGDLSEWIDNFIDENNLKNKCYRLGNIAYELLPLLYRSSDVFVFPSFREGSPKVLIEAAASGLPIIASDIPQNKDILKNFRNGLEFKVGDQNDLSAKIQILMKNSDLRDSFSKESRRIVQSEYDLIKKAMDLESIMKLNGDIRYIGYAK